MSQLKREFKGIWIPKEVWLSDELTLQEKVFYVEVDSLNNEDGCYANNEYFAKFFNISKVRVSEVINSLVKKGFITAVVDQSKGNRRTLQTLANFSLRPSQTNVVDPHKDSFNHSNTINNTVNSDTESKDSVPKKPLTEEKGNPKLSVKTEQKAPAVFAQCVDLWLKVYHPGWTFSAMHGKALKSILTKIKTSCTNAGLEGTDGQILASFMKLMTNLPGWYKDKDLPVINAKFNEIITEIQHHGKPKPFNSKNSADRFSDFAQ